MTRLTQIGSERTPMGNATGTQTHDPENFHPDTIAFGCLSWNVFSATLSIPHLIGKALKWRRPTTTFVTYIVGLLDGTNEISISHNNLSPLYCPDISTKSGAEKIRRALRSTEFDMAASACPAIGIKRGRVQRAKGDEEDIYIDTKYWLGDIRAIIEDIQAKVIEADLFSLPSRQRTRQLELIIREVLTKREYQPITAEQREAEKKLNAKAKGKECDATPATIEDADEGETTSKPTERRVTLDDINRQLDTSDQLRFECAIDLANLGWSTDRIQEKLLARDNEIMMRLEAAIARANAPTGPRPWKDTLYPKWADGKPKPF